MKKSIRYIIPAFLCLIFCSGCLKDTAFENGSIQSVHTAGVQTIIEMGLTATNSTGFLNRAYSNTDADTTINLVPVTLASSKPAPEDIEVTLKLDTALLDAYNDSNGTDYGIPDPAIWTVSNPNYIVTIPKGSNTGFLKMTFKPSSFLGGSYAFPFVIASINKAGYIISGNMSTAIAGIIVKNKYDGRYTVTGTLVDNVVPANSSVPGDPYPFSVDLITVDANSVVFNTVGAGLYHLIANGGVYGTFTPIFTFDPSNDGVISVKNYYGQPAPGNLRSAQIAPGANKLNADGSIDVNYTMIQAGTPRTSFTEHFEFVGQRP